MLTSKAALIGWLVFFVSCFGLAIASPTIDALANVTYVFNVFDNATINVYVANNASLIINGHNVTSGLATAGFLSSDGYIVSHHQELFRSDTSSAEDVGPSDKAAAGLEPSSVKSNVEPVLVDTSIRATPSAAPSPPVTSPGHALSLPSATPTLSLTVNSARGSGQDHTNVIQGQTSIATVTEIIQATVTVIRTVTATASSALSTTHHHPAIHTPAPGLAPFDDTKGEPQARRKSLVDESIGKRVVGLTLEFFKGYVAEFGFYRVRPEWKFTQVETGSVGSRIEQHPASKNESLPVELHDDQDHYPSATTPNQESASEPLTTSSPPSDGPSPPVTSPACPTATCPPLPTCTADTELASCLANQLAAEEVRQTEQHLYEQERQRLSTWRDQNLAMMRQNNAQAANIRRQRIALGHRYQLVLQNDPTGLTVYSGPRDLPTATQIPWRRFSALYLCCGGIATLFLLSRLLRRLRIAVAIQALCRRSAQICRRCSSWRQIAHNDAASMQIACRSPRHHRWIPATSIFTGLFAAARLQVIFSATDAFTSKLAKLHPVVYVDTITKLVICTRRNILGSTSISVVNTWIRVWAPRLNLDGPHDIVKGAIAVHGSPKTSQVEELSPVVHFVLIFSLVIMGTFSLLSRLISLACHGIVDNFSRIVADILDAVIATSPEQPNDSVGRMESGSATISPFNPETDSQLEIVSSEALHTPSPSPASDFERASSIVRTASVSSCDATTEYEIIAIAAARQSDVAMTEAGVPRVFSSGTPLEVFARSEDSLGRVLMPPTLDAVRTSLQMTLPSDADAYVEDDTVQGDVQEDFMRIAEEVSLEDADAATSTTSEAENAEMEDLSQQMLLAFPSTTVDVNDGDLMEDPLLVFPTNVAAISNDLVEGATSDIDSRLGDASSHSTCTEVASSPPAPSLLSRTTTSSAIIQQAQFPASDEPLVRQKDEAQRNIEQEATTDLSTDTGAAVTAEVAPTIIMSSVTGEEDHSGNESATARAPSVTAPSEFGPVQDGAIPAVAKQETESHEQDPVAKSAFSRKEEPRPDIDNSARISTAASASPATSTSETHDNQQSVDASSAAALQHDNNPTTTANDSNASAAVRMDNVDAEMREEHTTPFAQSGSLNTSDSGRMAGFPVADSAALFDDPMEGDQADVEMEEALEERQAAEMEVEMDLQDIMEVDADDMAIETIVAMDCAETPAATLAPTSVQESLVMDVVMTGRNVEDERDVNSETTELEQTPNDRPPAPGYAPDAVMEDAIAQTSIAEGSGGALAANLPPQGNMRPVMTHVNPAAPAQSVQAIAFVRSEGLARVAGPVAAQPAGPPQPVTAPVTLPSPVRPLRAAQSTRPVASAVPPMHSIAPNAASPSSISAATGHLNGNVLTQSQSSVMPPVRPKPKEAPLFMKKKPFAAPKRPSTSTSGSNGTSPASQAGRFGNDKIWNLTKPQDPSQAKIIHAAKTSTPSADHQYKVPALPARLSQTVTPANQAGPALPLTPIQGSQPRSQPVVAAPMARRVRPAGRASVVVATAATDADEEEEMNSMPRPPPIPANAMPADAAEQARERQEEVRRMIAEIEAQQKADEDAKEKAAANQGR